MISPSWSFSTDTRRTLWGLECWLLYPRKTSCWLFLWNLCQTARTRRVSIIHRIYKKRVWLSLWFTSPVRLAKSSRLCEAVWPSGAISAVLLEERAHSRPEVHLQIFLIIHPYCCREAKHPADRRAQRGERKAGRLQRNREHEKVSGCAKHQRLPSFHLLRVDGIIEFTNFLQRLEENLNSTDTTGCFYTVRASGVSTYLSTHTFVIIYTYEEGKLDIWFS